MEHVTSNVDFANFAKQLDMRNSRHRVNECWMKHIIKPLEFIFSIKMAKMTDGRYGYVCNLTELSCKSGIY